MSPLKQNKIREIKEPWITNELLELRLFIKTG